ncbi:MAG: nucleotidyl transferase AbiEii/AbiGii toxin family protein [Actinomycetota bacterium]|nr:nucleotidyl transferase AbiEii/AbiGii toxin family protein [Actinomycetota bacterium]
MAGLTRALITRHAAGRRDAYDAALLDVAQDHLLYLLAQLEVFSADELVFKGGTSLRKCRLGNDGRFSTDLDFAAPSDDVVLQVCAVVDGAAVGGFHYALRSTRGDGRHWDLTVTHDQLGSPSIPASMEFARRPLALAPEPLAFVALPIHRAYPFDLPVLPVIAEAEACAEKLARYRRTPLGRDLYDLFRFAGRPIDEPLVRRLWVLKVWGDVVDDGRGHGPLDPAGILTIHRPDEFAADSIGALTRPVDVVAWEAHVRARFGFLAAFADDERRWAACSERHRREVDRALAALGS